MRLVSFCELQANDDFDFKNNYYFYCGECFNRYNLHESFGVEPDYFVLGYNDETIGYFQVNQNALIVIYSIEEYNKAMGFDLLNEQNNV